MFKKLLPLLFLFAGFQANAALIQFQYDDIISYSSIPGLAAGQSATITVGLDNGGISNISQTWTATHLQSVTIDFDNGGLVTTFNSPWDGGLSDAAGDFVTDGSGSLTGVMTNWRDYNVSADVTTSGSGVRYFRWYLNGNNSFYHQSGNQVVHLTDVGDMLDAVHWSLVSDVPEPSIIALFGLGLVGIGFARRRQA